MPGGSVNAWMANSSWIPSARRMALMGSARPKLSRLLGFSGAASGSATAAVLGTGVSPACSVFCFFFFFLAADAWPPSSASSAPSSLFFFFFFSDFAVCENVCVCNVHA